jgi:hypothetical protein
VATVISDNALVLTGAPQAMQYVIALFTADAGE